MTKLACSAGAFFNSAIIINASVIICSEEKKESDQVRQVPLLHQVLGTSLRQETGAC